MKVDHRGRKSKTLTGIGLSHTRGCTPTQTRVGWEGLTNTHLSCLLAFVYGIGQDIGAGHAIAQPHHSCRNQGAEGLPHLIGVACREKAFNFLACSTRGRYTESGFQP